MEPKLIPQPYEVPLRTALAENQLDPSFARTVLDLFKRSDSQWRVCCGSNCDPCVDRLGRAVDRLRELTGESPAPLES